MTKENVKTLGDFTKRGSDIAQLRLANQRLSGTGFASPVEVVRWFGAMQSQDLPASLYAIGLRMTGATEAIVESALANGSIVRSWPMRRTIHCMAAEDVRWMIRMLAPRGIARMKPYHRAMKIKDDDLARAGRVLESALTREPRLTRAELYQRLNDEGLATNTPDIPMRGLHFLVHWAQAGLICLAARRGKQPTFALLDNWTPRGRDFSGDDALSELATIYFRAHGPATVRDFSWWTGFTMAEAKRATHLAGDLLHSATIDGVEYWSMRDAPTASSSLRPVLLLPPFDEYTVAYADRSAAADPSLLPSIGHGLAPNILVNGRIAGTWKRVVLAQGSVDVTPSLLHSLRKKEQSGLACAIKRYADFLGCEIATKKACSRPENRVRKGQGQP
jgi:Winged helix DNA-binding domain